MRTLASPEHAAQWLREGLAATAQLATDHRRVRPGDGFLAWPGARTDARQHLAAALAAGAARCLVQADGQAERQPQGQTESAAPIPMADDTRVAALPALKARAGEVAAGFFGHPSRRLRVLACTGTNGKTSSSWWTAQALRAAGVRCAVVGTLGVGELAGAGADADADADTNTAHSLAALQSTGLTTPDAVQLQAALAGFVARGVQACAIEASSIGIVEHRLAGLHIEVALFTNLTQDHLDYHGSMAAYGAAKAQLFRWPGLRAAVINADDAFGASLAAELAQAQQAAGAPELWTLSLHEGSAARLRAHARHHTPDGLTFDVSEGWPSETARHSLRAGVVGEFNAANVLGVLGCLRAYGLPLADAVAALGAIAPVPGRLQRVAAPAAVGGPEVVVDYAHTPDALAQVLHALRPRAAARGGRLWLVFGCGGNRDAAKRAPMGAIAAERADRCLVTSDNPRDEDPEAIVAQVMAGVPAGQRGSAVRAVVDRREAIALALAEADDADLVLLAGKGHETEQRVRGQALPFSDADEARAALARRGSRPC